MSTDERPTGSAGGRTPEGCSGRLGVPEHLGRKALLPLWNAVHDRLSSGTAVRSVTVRGLDEEEQAALADLLGLVSYPGARTSVRLDRLDRALAPLGLDARAVASAVVGPIDDRAAHRVRTAEERERLWAWLASSPLVSAQPALARWVELIRADRVPRGDTEGLRRRLEQALAVLAALPLADGRPLPTLAAETTGDPHALDGTKALPGLVLRALAVLRDVDAPANARERRALWGGFGVDCDSHSTSVLVLGLRPSGAGPLASTLRVWADTGRAAVVTLDQLSAVSDSAELAQPCPVVFVVENPSVLAHAQRVLGSDCPPLVCVSGWPNSAAIALLRTLSEGGAELRYHGDFDGEGLRIAAHLMAVAGVAPWRMGADDYLAALPGVQEAPAPGRVTPAPWDPDLADAITAEGVAVHEERVADTLVADLRAAAAKL
ncbi:TIGR02679 family protein [Nocardiopsis exhalans]|uniref:TIGR02679 family protein n=1 Tax=Nocardiopsis exhalans TaxID=163604 RepID=A0ABY5DGF0_9ACTN|nr:TIGR02679 family protein [Nocardiopsis exhalans]USY22464.1 TIGR02679 family protein [Nocardiopsis exhalans]